MINRIRELNRILFSVSALMDENKCARYESVLEDCNSMVIEGQMPDHELSIEFCNMIGFLSLEKKRVYITKHAELFMELNPKGLYELSPGQKRFILRFCYLSGALRKSTLKCFKSFSPTYKKNTFRWSELDSPGLDCEDWIPEHLIQLGVLKRGSNWLEVCRQYVSTIEAFLEEKKGWTEEQFFEYLREKKAIGDIAEELIYEYEVKRLKKMRCNPEAGCIQIISKLKVSEGYDIESFNGKSKNMKYDRYIEVKGSRKSELRFIWSINEIKIAEKLGDSYWIYYQGGIDGKTRKAKNQPLLFQNPFKTILENKSFLQTHNGLIIESNIKGNSIN